MFKNVFSYLQFSLHNSCPSVPRNPASTQKAAYIVVGHTPKGQLLIAPQVISSDCEAPPEEDRLYNYCNNLCHWTLQLMSMNDTAKEGDITRVIPNCLWNLPFFYSHSKLSKYFVENLDYIVKAEFLGSPLEKLRILEGSFINYHGGRGNNVESDLVQEQSVKNAKNLVRQLGANKTEDAINRACGAADAVAGILENLDISLNIKDKSSRPAKKLAGKDETLAAEVLREIRPFKKTPGRKCEGFNSIGSSPFSSIQKTDMKIHMDKTISRLIRGQMITYEDDEEVEK